MRCIIHIGTEKTGSTAIQEYLSGAGEKFRDAGIHVCTSAGKGNNRALPAAFMSADKTDDYLRAQKIEARAPRATWKARLLHSFSKEVQDAGANADAFLLSSEHFQSRLTSPEEVVELHSFLATLFDEFEIICYLRRQDQMALSRYSQALRAGYTPASPLPRRTGKGAHRVPHYFDFESLLNRWADAFGEQSIKPRVYSRAALDEGDIVSDFLVAIGVASPRETPSRKKNIAMSAAAQTVLFGVNKRLSECDWHSARDIRLPLVEYLEAHAPGKSRQPTVSQAVAFYRVFEHSNSAVAKRWFGRDSLFEAEFSEYPAEEQTVDAGEVAELLADFMCRQLGIGS